MSDRSRVLELFEQKKDSWQSRAARDIEKYRKGNAALRVVDSTGAPLADATLRVVQEKHAFRFGANLFMLEEMESEEKNQAYQKAFADLFNMATLPFYWDALEPEEGKLRYAKDSRKIYRRPAPDLCIEYCQANGIEPREHALAYDSFFPQWLKNASVAEVKKALERRFAQVAERYADKIRTIEVTNEMEWRSQRTAFYSEPDFIEWCFKTARKYFPHNQLGINEWAGLCWVDAGRPTDKYYAYTEANLLKGAPIDAIGMQYHQFWKREHEYDATRDYYDPDKLFHQMDLYAGFGKPLQLTEVTIPAYSEAPEDEEMQAKIMEYLYTIWFSHPNMEQIIYWNLVDGYAHVPNPDPEAIKATQGNMTVGENYYYGGLLRFDMTPKPSYYKVKELFEKTWHTEATLTADRDGCAAFRGFYGDYRVEVSKNGKTVTLPMTLSKDGDHFITVVL